MSKKGTRYRAQFTFLACTGRIAWAGMAMRMDGRGRALDKIFVERLWRSVTFPDMYLKA
jgi:putative transposase